MKYSIRRHSRRSRRSRKQRRTLRQYGRGVEKEWIEPIHRAVKQFFPDSKYDIKFYSNNERTVIHVFIYCPGKELTEDELMVSFTVSTDEIYIHSIAGCFDPSRHVRGERVLTSIILLGKELKPLGIQRMKLLDASSIPYPLIPRPDPTIWKCSISLPVYKILTSPQHHSWYNSHGFVSDMYEEEVKHNTAFAKEPMIKLLEKTHAYMAYSKGVNRSLNRLFSRKKKSVENRPSNKVNRMNLMDTNITKMNMDMLIEYFHRAYEGEVTLDMPIEQGIQLIHRMALKATSCNDPKVILYTQLMNGALKYGIMYDKVLSYTL